MTHHHPGEQRLAALAARVEPIGPDDLESTQQRLNEGEAAAGGSLAAVAARLCAVHRHEPPRVNRRLMVVGSADHGTGTGSEPIHGLWSGAKVMKFLEGEGALNHAARSVGVPVRLIDVGVAGDLPDHPGLIRRKVAWGTAPVHRGAAMGRAQAVESVLAGVDAMAEYNAGRTVDAVGVGTMSAGDAVSARLIAATLLGETIDAGDDRQLAAACRLHLGHLDTGDMIAMLADVGGFDIGALVGVYLAAAAGRIVAITDGFTSTVAASMAVAFCPAVRDYVFVSHLSADPLHARLAERFDGPPLLGFPLGEENGVGAALGLGVLATAVSIWGGGKLKTPGS